MLWIRRLYEWVLNWAETPYGTIALFVIAVIESIFFPVPPDILLIALGLGKRKRALYYGLICSIGSLCGGMIGYMLGNYAWLTPDGFTPLAQFFFHHVPGFSEPVYFDLGQRFEEWGFVIIFTAGFTPIPYKLFTVSAGAFATSLPLFLLASATSRTARFMIVSGLIWRFGEPVRTFIDRYFNWLAIIFAVLLAVGFATLKFLT
ncbi:MAG: DedA family protein [Bacteroidetes bacterium]|nr:DedA family protein [Bacteroidota bacterium]MCY4233432.1 DedA family protein [Bacteroidota bacterium]